VPDLKTGLLTYPEFREAMAATVPTANRFLVLLDINGSGTRFLKMAEKTGDPCYGDKRCRVLADWVRERLQAGEFAGGGWGDLFAVSLHRTAGQARSFVSQLQRGPEPVRAVLVPYADTPLDTVKAAYGSYFAKHHHPARGKN
jgi:hypothetical protein